MDVSSFAVKSVTQSTAVPMPAQAPTEAAPDAPDVTPEAQAATPAVAADAASSEPAAASEAAADPTTTEPEKPAKVDPRFSALARKEALLYREREAIKAEKAALAQAHRQVVAFEEARNAAKMDPLAVLSALGLTYDDVTAKALGVEKPTTPEAEVAAVRADLERFRAEQAEAAKQAEEAKAQALEAERAAVIETFRRDAVAHVEANAERYELTRIHNAASLVPQVVEQHFAATGKLLDVAQAAELVEKHFEQLTEKAANARKFQARTEAKKSTPAVAPAAPAAKSPAAAPSKTLSNTLTASAPTTAPKARTDEDRIRAALARLSGN
jgi:hypothetical protein